MNAPVRIQCLLSQWSPLGKNLLDLWVRSRELEPALENRSNPSQEPILQHRRTIQEVTGLTEKYLRWTSKALFAADSLSTPTAVAWTLAANWTALDAVFPGGGIKRGFAYFFRADDYTRFDWVAITSPVTVIRNRLDNFPDRFEWTPGLARWPRQLRIH